jgi:hypothetical protein
MASRIWVTDAATAWNIPVFTKIEEKTTISSVFGQAEEISCLKTTPSFFSREFRQHVHTHVDSDLLHNAMGRVIQNRGKKRQKQRKSLLIYDQGHKLITFRWFSRFLGGTP